MEEKEVVLANAIGGSIGSAIAFAAFRTKSKKLVYSFLLGSSLALCTLGIFQKLENMLLDASRCGDTAKVKFLLKIGMSVITGNSLKEALLLSAVEGNHIETVKLLLQYKVNVNYGLPLMLAIRNGYIEIIELFLEHGADVNAKDSCNNTPLHESVIVNGHIEMVRLLVENGADINAVGYYGCTPLNRALHYEPSEIIIFLLKKGADANLPDIDQFTPMCNLLSLSNIHEYGSARHYLKTFVTLLIFVPI